MNARIRRVALVIVVLFVAIAGQLTYLQLVVADDLSAHPGNVRQILRTYAEPRGRILTAEEEVVARSEGADDELRFRRRYPAGELFAHITGMFSFTFGATGVENTFNNELAGRTENLRYRNLGDLLIGKEHTGTIVLSVRADVQEAARAALDGRRGSVVALDATTGEILALYSEPSYDPEPLSDHDQSKVRAYYDGLDPGAADSPLVAAAWRKRYPPGSTFKIVTTAAALDEGLATPDREFPSVAELDLPLTDRTLKNFGTSTCGGTLAESFRRSCNTTFARLGLELGDRFPAAMAAFGVTSRPPIDMTPRPAAGEGPLEGTFERNQPLFAQAGIGQGEVFVTPLHMALITAAIANDGVMMKPHVVKEIRDIDGVVVRRIAPEVWRTATAPDTARTIREMMVQVVAAGTGGRAQIPGVEVAGKTGTAQEPGGPPHTWFVAFAPADAPRVAVAVLVERGGDLGDEATGGRVAAPVAKTVLEAALSGVPEGDR